MVCRCIYIHVFVYICMYVWMVMLVCVQLAMTTMDINLCEHESGEIYVNLTSTNVFSH